MNPSSTALPSTPTSATGIASFFQYNPAFLPQYIAMGIPILMLFSDQTRTLGLVILGIELFVEYQFVKAL